MILILGSTPLWLESNEPGTAGPGLTPRPGRMPSVAVANVPRLTIRVAAPRADSFPDVARGLSASLQRVLRSAILGCLTIAIESQDEAFDETPSWVPRTAAGLVGAISGLFGAIAMPIELPFTLMLILRAIADVARRHGEDLRLPEARLACLEVLALGDGKPGTRAAIKKITRDVVVSLAGQRVLDAAAPAVSRLVVEVASRLGVILSERISARAIPLLGAAGGAMLNVVIMDRFIHVAEDHFVTRRLERARASRRIGRQSQISSRTPAAVWLGSSRLIHSERRSSPVKRPLHMRS